MSKCLVEIIIYIKSKKGINHNETMERHTEHVLPFGQEVLLQCDPQNRHHHNRFLGAATESAVHQSTQHWR
ncbi:hypothetical protein evm_008557 [Chilo suppressalis]|nr:hypothetical protein evm_008557 [Chilo suppressalis]